MTEGGKLIAAWTLGGDYKQLVIESGQVEYSFLTDIFKIFVLFVNVMAI